MSQAGPRRGGRPGGGSSGAHSDAAVVTTMDDGVAVLDVTGSFPGAAAAANRAIRRALFREPRAIACDLSAVQGDLDGTALDQLVDTGGHLEHWPGTCLALVGPADRFGDTVATAGGGVLLLAATLPEAMLAMSERPRASTAGIHLEAHPRASRAARDFVSRTCLDWRRPHGIPSAVLVVSELVTNGLIHSGTDLDVTLAAVGSRLRLAVYDGHVAAPRMLRAGAEHGKARGMHLVAGFSRAWGSLPGPDGGKAVWAVLDT